MRNRVYLSLGSNISKEHNLPLAVAMLAETGRLFAVSAAYETAAVGGEDYPGFLNAAVALDTDLGPGEFKAQVIGPIEAQLGRVRDPEDRNAPRTIDIDIVLWNDEVLDGNGVVVPDPDLLRLAHLAVPLAEIAPDLVHPLSGEKLTTIAGRLVAAGQIVTARGDVVLDMS